MSLVPYTNNQLSVGANGSVSPYLSGNLCTSLPSGNNPFNANNDTLENFFYNKVGFITFFNTLIGQTAGNVICLANIAVTGGAGSPSGTVRVYSGQTLIGSVGAVSSDSSAGGAFPLTISNNVPIKDLRLSWQSNAVFGGSTSFNISASNVAPT